MKKYMIIGASALIIFSGIIGMSLNAESAEARQDMDTFIFSAKSDAEEDRQLMVPDSTPLI